MSSELKLKKALRSKNSPFSAKRPTDNFVALQAMQLEYSMGHGVNFRDRIITITGVIEEPLFSFIDCAISEMEYQSKKGITIRINSGGGSVYEALAIVGRIKSAKVAKITTEGFGQIMSAATILLACGDLRKINKYAYFMHHESAYGVLGKVSEHKDYLEQVEREEHDWAKWMAELSKKSLDFWKKAGVRKDAYFSPKELIKLGVADEIF